MEAFEYATMTAAVWLWERVGVGWVRMVAIRTLGPRCAAFPAVSHPPLTLTCCSGHRVL